MLALLSAQSVEFRADVDALSERTRMLGITAALSNAPMPQAEGVTPVPEGAMPEGAELVKGAEFPPSEEAEMAAHCRALRESATASDVTSRKMIVTLAKVKTWAQRVSETAGRAEIGNVCATVL